MPASDSNNRPGSATMDRARSYRSSGSASSASSQPFATNRVSTGTLMRQPPGAGVAIERSKFAFPGASLTFKELGFSVPLPKSKESKVILEPCSGHFDPGQLVAIMGPSGCGKSTLLDMLAMKKNSPHTGSIAVNGNAPDPVLFQRIAAYVGQEDNMPGHWKVREALEFNVALKQLNANKAKTSGFVDNLLESFGLQGVAGTYIGGAEVRGISGGQRRRVTLARGVASQASILFCDEPTSGLSATDAELCIKALRVIAKRMNVLIPVVIHQPRREVASLFDTLVLLTSNPGRMTYFGPMKEAVHYVETCGFPVPAHGNPTDYFLDLVTPGTDLDASNELVVAFQGNQLPGVRSLVEDALATRGMTMQEMVVQRHEQQCTSGRVRFGPYAVPFLSQFFALLRRKMKLTLRNPAAIGMQLAMPAFMGCVLGAIFQGIGDHDFNIPTVEFIFILLTMLSLQSLPLMPLLIDERRIMMHETSERLYTEMAHILTTFFVTVPLSLAGAAGQTLIIYAFSGLNYEYLPIILGWTLLLFFLFDALFSCVSAAAPDAQQAQTMAVPFLVVFMLFNGVVVTRETAPVFLKWIFEISPTHYAMQGIVLRMTEHAGKVGQLIVATSGYEKGQDFKGIVIIACMILVLRTLQVLALKYMNKIQK